MLRRAVGLSDDGDFRQHHSSHHGLAAGIVGVVGGHRNSNHGHSGNGNSNHGGSGHGVNGHGLSHGLGLFGHLALTGHHHHRHRTVYDHGLDFVGLRAGVKC